MDRSTSSTPKIVEWHSMSMRLTRGPVEAGMRASPRWCVARPPRSLASRGDTHGWLREDLGAFVARAGALVQVPSRISDLLLPKGKKVATWSTRLYASARFADQLPLPPGVAGLPAHQKPAPRRRGPHLGAGIAARLPGRPPPLRCPPRGRRLEPPSLTITAVTVGPNGEPINGYQEAPSGANVTS